MRVILRAPYLLNPEYQNELGRTENIEQLNELNARIWMLYNLTSTNYAARNQNYFWLVMSSLFSEIDDFEQYYLCNTLPEIDGMVQEHLEREAYRKQFKQTIYSDIKSKRK